MAIPFHSDIQLNGALTVGVDDTGHDVKFFGATSGKYLMWDESQDRLEFADNTYAAFGTDGDMLVYHNGTDGFITEKTGHLYIRTQADDKDIIFQSDDGSGGVATYFYLDGSITHTRFAKSVLFDNDVNLDFGSSGNTRIKTNGTNTFIQNYVGDFYIDQNLDDGDIIFRCDDGSGGITAYLTLDGSSGYIRLEDDRRLTIGSSNDLQLRHNSNNSYITNFTGPFNIVQQAADQDIIFQSDDGSGGVTDYIRIDGGDTNIKVSKPMQFGSSVRAYFGSSNNSEIVHNGTDMSINNFGGDLKIINYTDDKDIIFQSDDGSGGVTEYFRVDGSSERTVFSKEARFSDNVILSVGSGQDLKLLHDGTNTVVDNFTGHLYFRNFADDQDIIFQSDDGSGGVETYFYLDGSTGRTRFNDSKYLVFGTDQNLFIVHDGTNSYIQNYTSGDFYIDQRVADKDIVFRADDGAGGTTAYLRLDGSTKTVDVDVPIEINDQMLLGSKAAYTLPAQGTRMRLLQIADNTLCRVYLETSENSYHQPIVLDIFYRAQFTTSKPQIVRSESYEWHTHSNDVIFTSDQAGTVGADSYIYAEKVLYSTGRPLNIRKIEVFDGTVTVLDGSTTDTNGGTDETIVSTFAELNLGDNDYLRIGDGNDLQLYHNGTHSYMGNYVGDLVIFNHTNDGDLILQCDDQSGGVATYFYLDGSVGFNRFPYPVIVEDSVNFNLGTGQDMQLLHNGSDSVIRNATGDLYIQQNADDKDIIFQSDNGSGGVTAYFQLDGSLAGVGGDVYTKWPDNSYASFGNGPDMFIGHNGTNSIIRHSTASDLIIENTSDDRDVILKSDDGSGGVTAYITLDGSEGHTVASKEINFSDGIPATFGNKAGGDLEIKEQSGNSYISNFTGNLEITNHTDDGDIIFKSDDGSGGTTPYITLDGSQGFTTVQKNFRMEDGKRLQVGSSADLTLLHESDNTTIDNYTGDLTITQNTDDGDIIFKSDNGSGGVATYFKLDGGNAQTEFERNVKFLDTIELRLGTSNDLKIYHDGSNSYIKEIGTGTLRLQTNGAGIDFYKDSTEFLARLITDGAVELYYDSAKKFETTSTGVNITGGDSVAPQISILHDGTNPGTNEELGVIQFQVDYDGSHQDWGKIRLDTNASAVRTNMEFYVKSTSGNEELALTLEGQPSATPNATFEGKLQVNQQGNGTSNLPSPVAVLSGQNTASVVKALSLVNSVTAASGNGTQIAFHNASNYSPTGTITTIQDGDVVTDSKMEFQIYNGGLQTALTIDHDSNATFAGSVTADTIVINDTDSTRGVFRNDAAYDLRLGGGTVYSDGAYISLSGGIRGGGTSNLKGRIEMRSGGSNYSAQADITGDIVIGTQWNGGSSDILTLDSSTNAATFAGDVVINKGTSATATQTFRRDTSGDAAIIGDINFSTSAAEGTDDRVGLIRTSTQGGTSTTRGGIMYFFTRGANSSSFNTTSYNHIGSWSFPNDVTIAGDLTVNGTTVTVDTTNLNVQDKNITLNYSTGDSSSTADGAGITIQDAVNSDTDATILWTAASDRFDFSHGATFTNNVGIGTSSPTHKLEVRGGDTHFENTSSTNTFLDVKGTSANAYIRAYSDSNSVWLYQGGSSSYLSAQSGSTLRLNSGTTDLIFSDNSSAVLSFNSSNATFAGTITHGGSNESSGVIDKRNYYCVAGSGGGNFLIGQIETSANADGAIAGTVYFAYDYGTTSDNPTIHFNFAQRSGTARGTWWYEGDDQDATSDRVSVKLIDDGSGNMYVWVVIADYAAVWVETRQRHINSAISSGQLTSGTITTGTTLFDTANNPTAEMHVGSATFAGQVAVGGGAGNGQLDVSRSGGAGVRLQAQASAGVVGTSTNHRLDIKTNDSTRLSISNSGAATFNHDVILSSTAPTLRIQDSRNLNNPDWDNVSLGNIEFYTSDTTSPGARVLAEIEAFSNATAASGPNADLIFKTSEQTDSSPQTRLTIGYNGVSTFTGNVTVGSNSLTAGSLDINGNADISGNLTMSGNANLVMGTGQLKFADSGYIYLGDSNDLQIYHNATDSKIDNYTGDLYITNFADDKDIIFRSDDGAGGFETYFYLDGSASSGEPYTVWPDSSIAAWGTGVDFRIKHDGSNTYLYNTTGHAYFINYADDKDIIFQSDDGSGGLATYFFLDGSASSGAGFTVFPDSSTLAIGDGYDMRFQHNGTNSYILNYTGNIEIEQNADDADIIFKCDNGSGGTTAYLTLDGSNTTIKIEKDTFVTDNTLLGVGDGSDLRMSHNGTNSFIDNYTGDFYIRQRTDDKDLILQCDDGSGGVESYFALDGGANANVSFKSIFMADNKRFYAGGGGDLGIYHDGTNNYIDNTNGDLYIRNTHDDKDIIFQSDDGSGGVTEYFRLDGSSTQTIFSKNQQHADNVTTYYGNAGDLSIHHNGSNSYITQQGTGDLYLMNTTDDKDIIFVSDDGAGGTAEYFRLDGSVGGGSTVHTVFPDNSKAVFGTGLDLQIYHDASNSYIKQQGGGDLYIQQTTDDKDIIFQSDDGSGGVTTYFFLDGSLANGTATYTRWADNDVVAFGDSQDFLIYHDASNTILYNSVGDIRITNTADDKDISFRCDDGSGGTTEYFRLDGSTTSMQAAKNIVFADSIRSVFGGGNDLAIYHNATDSVIQNETGDLYIANAANDKDIIFQCDDGSGGLTTYLQLDGSSASVFVNRPTIFYDTLTIPSEIIHSGDTDTKIAFGTNTVTVTAGNVSNIEASATGASIPKRKFSKSGTTDGDHDGDIVYFGGTTSMEVGEIYYLTSSGTWALADADAESTAKGMLAVALGGSSDTDGMLVRGFVTLDHDPGTVGDTLFLSTTAGLATATAPSGNGDIVRVIGYCLDSTNGQIYFNPDGTFVEVSA